MKGPAVYFFVQQKTLAVEPELYSKHIPKIFQNSVGMMVEVNKNSLKHLPEQIATNAYKTRVQSTFSKPVSNRTNQLHPIIYTYRM